MLASMGYTGGKVCHHTIARRRGMPVYLIGDRAKVGGEFDTSFAGVVILVVGARARAFLSGG